MALPKLIPKETLEESLQWNADSGRLLKIALRNHDPVALEEAQKRISEKYNCYIAAQCTFAMITHLIETENWSWQLTDGSASPLI